MTAFGTAGVHSVGRPRYFAGRNESVPRRGSEVKRRSDERRCSTTVYPTGPLTCEFMKRTTPPMVPEPDSSRSIRGVAAAGDGENRAAAP